eukprot:TRINITY_DN19150_c0_g1_i2.p1 TRINITY_DN19150_c0_g1~~TRINITY_DN19150_c0_g1_i2.p1  ORF type:complete len:291 (+),score=55.60 TRINITY_DN19150_c0_g1_i2:79-951(+)
MAITIGNVALEETGTDILDLLPPLHSPKRAELRGETLRGAIGVPAICAILLGWIHVGVWLMTPAVPDWVSRLLLRLGYFEVAVANFFMILVFVLDPGVIKRSSETCLPLPDAVLERVGNASLGAGAGITEALAQLTENVREPGRSYCARCHVWRAAKEKHKKSCHWSIGGCIGGGSGHHCSSCQHCVKDFDHHCHFYGRCIGGRWFRGNVFAFRMTIYTGYAGFVTSMFTFLLGLYNTSWGSGPVAYVLIYIAIISVLASIRLWRKVSQYSLIGGGDQKSSDDDRDPKQR